MVATSNKELSNYIEEIGNLPAADQAKDLGIIHNPGQKTEKGLKGHTGFENHPGVE